MVRILALTLLAVSLHAEPSARLALAQRDTLSAYVAGQQTIERAKAQAQSDYEKAKAHEAQVMKEEGEKRGCPGQMDPQTADCKVGEILLPKKVDPAKSDKPK